MNDEKDQQAQRVAEAISDGAPIDWDAVLRANVDLRGTLGELRVLESIARAHGYAASPVPVSPAPRVPSATPIEDLEQTQPLATWGTLRVLEQLGEGGFAVVYRAHDPSLERDVALKLWRVTGSRERAIAQRMLAEARQLARVRHANVLMVHGAAEYEGQPGLWMDLLRGRTLEQELAERGVLGAQEAATIGLDLCRALAAVHAAGLIHRDVKTQNVMREEGGRIVLMDFSAAVESEPADEAQNEGTPLTMAPEQLRGTPATPATDVYGLGVLLYRLVSGRYPIEAKTRTELHDAHARKLARPLRDLRPDLPTDFVHVVERALTPELELRFASMGAMERALAGVVGAASSPPVTAPETKRRTRLDGRLLAATVLVAVLAVALWARPWSRRTDAAGETASDAARSPAATTVAPLSVSALLYRQTADGEERLLPGARVRPGDALFMELESNDSVHVYVLNEDASGEVYALFPGPSFELRNPLSAGTSHRLPGTIRGQRASWQVTSAGGRERVVVIASRQRLPDVERDIAAMPPASPDRPVTYARVGPGTMQALRGMGGVLVEPPAAARTGSRLSGVMDSLPSRSGATGDVWAWQFELENPRR